MPAMTSFRAFSPVALLGSTHEHRVKNRVKVVTQHVNVHVGVMMSPCDFD
jgi:hypothetical protein